MAESEDATSTPICKPSLQTSTPWRSKSLTGDATLVFIFISHTSRSEHSTGVENWRSTSWRTYCAQPGSVEQVWDSLCQRTAIMLTTSIWCSHLGSNREIDAVHLTELVKRHCVFERVFLHWTPSWSHFLVQQNSQPNASVLRFTNLVSRLLDQVRSYEV